MSELLWKVFFYDRDKIVTRTNLDGLADLPILPVVMIAIVRRDQNGTRICIEFGRNYYCLVGDEWWASTLSGLLNYLDFNRGTAAVLRGGMVPNDVWQKTYKEVYEDPELLSVTKDWFERNRGEAED